LDDLKAMHVGAAVCRSVFNDASSVVVERRRGGAGGRRRQEGAINNHVLLCSDSEAKV